MRRAAAATALAVAAGAATAPPASAQTPFRGLSGQRQPIVFEVGQDGRVGSGVVTWQARCPGRRPFPVQETRFAPPEGRASRRVVVGRGAYRVAAPGGRIGRVTIRLDGRVRGDPARPERQRWTGTLRARVAVRRHARSVGTCRVTTRWIARAEGIGAGVVAMQTERNAGGGAPRDLRFAAPAATVSARGQRSSVVVKAEDPEERVEVSLQAPALNRLVVGRRYEARGSVEGAARVSVTGADVVCFGGGGSFVVQRLKFDRLRRLVALTATFEALCSEDDARGTIEWTAANP